MDRLLALSEQKGNRYYSGNRSSVKNELGASKYRRSVSADSRSRGSYIPERKRQSSEERKSGNLGCMRWSGARKSSLSDLKRSLKDTRPLSDKAYQKKKIHEIVEFLQEQSDFKYPLSVSKLMSPSKKDFEVIFQFLYCYFVPSYQVTRIEEEAPKILKNFGYPFTVNKSSFTCVTRSTWPALLGIIIWFVDLIKFEMKIDEKYIFEAGAVEEKAHVHSIFLRYIWQRYHSSIDNAKEDETVFAEIVKSSLTESVDELLEKNEEKKKLKDSVESEIIEMKNLAEKKTKYETDIEKYEEFKIKMKSHYQNKNEIYEQLLSELKAKDSELKNLQEQISKKQDLYDAQGFDGKKQLHYFENEKKELMEKLNNKDNTLKELQDKLWEFEIRFNQNLDKIISTNESFNEIYATTVQEARTVLQPLQNVNVPQLQKLYSSFYLDFPDFVSQSNRSCVEWNSVCKDILEGMENKIIALKENIERIMMLQNEKLMEIQMKQAELSAELKLLTLMKNKVEHDLSSKEKQAMDEILSLETRCEKMEEVVKSLQAKKLKLINTHKEMIEENKSLKAFVEQREKDIEKYLSDQKKLFEYCSKMKAKAENLSEEYGNEIAAKLEDLNFPDV